MSAADKNISIKKNDSEEIIEVSLFDFLREHFAKHKIADSEDLPSFVGGAIGYFGFSCVGWFEKSLKNLSVEKNSDDALLMFFRTVVAFDHAKQVIKIISLVFTDEADGDEQKLKPL